MTEVRSEVHKRFYMLAVFVWASLLQSLTWPPIAAAPAAAKYSFPGLTDAEILWSLNWGPIAQLIIVPFAMVLINFKRGLNYVVYLGVACATGTAAIRLAVLSTPEDFRRRATARWALQFAGMLCGASGAFMQGAPTRFSAIWFPPEQRARATGCAFVGLGLGQAICYVVTPLLVSDRTMLMNSLIFQIAVAMPVVVCLVAYYPTKPRGAWWLLQESAGEFRSSGNSVQAADQRDNRFEEQTSSSIGMTDSFRMVHKVICQPSCLLICILCSLANGPYQAWGAALPTIYAHLKYTPAQCDILSFGSMFSYTAGCYLVGELGDRVFRHRYKRLLLYLVLGALASFIWLCLMLPTGLEAEPLMKGNFPLVVVAVVLTGWFVGATNPICMELCAELTYPVQEGISGNFIIAVTQVFTILLLAIFPLMNPLDTTPVMVIIMALCILTLFPVKEQYLRSDAEQACCAGGLGQHLT